MNRNFTFKNFSIRALLIMFISIASLGNLFSQTFTELVIPKYMGSKTAASANNARTPVAFCFSVTGLKADTIYDVKIGMALTSEAATTYGAGNMWNGTAYSGSSYSKLITTDASGNSGPVWVFFQPTGNGTRFGGGAIHNLRIGLTKAGGTMPSSPLYVCTKTTTALDIATTALTAGTADDGAFIAGSALAVSGGKYVLIFDNVAGTGDPLFAYQIRQAIPTNGANTELPTTISDIYLQTGASAIGDYPAVIPIGANNPNGIQRIESRNADNTLFAYKTDDDGIWPSGANTTTAARRDVVIISNTDAPLQPAVSSSITITAPAAGNEWMQGTSHNITWTATGTNTNVKIEYTGNASNASPTWVTLNENETTTASAGTYSAEVPVDLPVSTDSKIRISDIPETASAMSDIFSITAAPVLAPVATFNPMDGATNVGIAKDIIITFDVAVRNLDNSEITDVNVASLLTFNTTDALGTAVPFTATIAADKKVITLNPDADLLNSKAYYVALAPVEGVSDNATELKAVTFTTIGNLAPVISDVTITEVAPYNAGDMITINWVSENVSNVKIEAWIPSQSKWDDIFPSSIPSDGSETFTIPIDANYSADYKIRVSDASDLTVFAESSTFTINPAISEVGIGETAPYHAGDEITITWKSNNVTNVMIEVWSPGDNKWDVLIPTTVSDGSEAFTVPANVAYSAEYKIRVSDVTNANASAESSPFTIIAVVDNLMALRAQPVNAIVKYTGVATVTFAQASRNQKYIQDETAAVLIDDLPGFIGSYYEGEGITNIEGKILLYNALIEFTPLAATGEHTTGTVIVPEVRTLASLTSADQCKLVKIENFAFKSPTGVFVKSTNYDIEGQANTAMVFRTAFAAADYIGGTIPVGPISSVCIVGQFKLQMQITARSWSDMVLPVEFPKLVITEIMYNSPESTDEEWFELYNNGTSTVDMEGFYMVDSDTAHVHNPWVFPAGSTIAPGEYFTAKMSSGGAFPFTPDAELTNTGDPFNLGNTSDQVKIYTKDGQLIDSVQYADKAPWPTAADGGGASLTLCDPNSDNSLASSWEASLDALAGTALFATPGSGCVIHTAIEPKNQNRIAVYPNPTSDNLYISNQTNEMLEITILSAIGKPVRIVQSNQAVTSVDLSDLPKGIYLVKMLNKTSKKNQVQKVVVK